MDVFGQALSDYYFKREGILWLHNSYDEPEEMPVDVFFREEADMQELELLALDYCEGKILDVGAGVGCMALPLQNSGKEVTALELNPTACSLMKQRGVRRVINSNIFNYHDHSYNTLLLMMNGIGLAGTVEGLRRFLKVAGNLLEPGGRIIFDSSDISYLYEENVLPADRYYGQISYRYEYNANLGPWFNWLYIDWHTMDRISAAEGWQFHLLYQDDNQQYLGALVQKT